MADISKIDPNFAVGGSIEREGCVFYSAEESPFRLSGVFREGARLLRLPNAVARQVSDPVVYLSKNNAGGRVCFRTDSPYVAISAHMDCIGRMCHFPLTGAAGFDLYVDNVFTKGFSPTYDVTDKLEGIFDFNPERKMREICINFPLYSGVLEVFVGLDKDARLEAPTPYVNDKPIVYYGSSITQGGCASRPGMSYQAIVSRHFNCEYLNLGFSGSAKAEEAMIEYIKGLEMSHFVYDYDHNAPTVEHLNETHEKMFLAIRESHPDIPIIMMQRPKFYLNEQEKERGRIIRQTYLNALNRGDKNVYFISNLELCAFCGNDGTVDGTHPTDFGFMSMAKAVIKLFESEKLI